MNNDQKNIYNNRYDRNIGVISKQEGSLLKAAKVCVVGCGGLGGYIIEYLGRMGIGNIVCVDGDVFDETNLNRQILATEKNIGTSKAQAAKLRMAEVNSEVNVTAVEEFFTAQNGDEILEGCTIAIDALDSIPARLVLEAAAEKADIPLVHGAIAGWNGQAAVVMPGDRLFETIYAGSDTAVDSESDLDICSDSDTDPGLDANSAFDSDNESGLEAHSVTETDLKAGMAVNPNADTDSNSVAKPGDGNPPFTAAMVAAIEAAESIKLLLDRDGTLKNQMLVIDLLTHEYELIQL